MAVCGWRHERESHDVLGSAWSICRLCGSAHIRPQSTVWISTYTSTIHCKQGRERGREMEVEPEPGSDREQERERRAGGGRECAAKWFTTNSNLRHLTRPASSKTLRLPNPPQCTQRTLLSAVHPFPAALHHFREKLPAYTVHAAGVSASRSPSSLAFHPAPPLLLRPASACRLDEVRDVHGHLLDLVPPCPLSVPYSPVTYYSTWTTILCVSTAYSTLASTTALVPPYPLSVPRTQLHFRSSLPSCQYCARHTTLAAHTT